MSVAQPKVWFERPVLADLANAVAERVTMLGPASATPEEPYEALGDAEGIVASVHRYDAALMDRGPALRVIARTGIGYERVDLAAATERGIAVCNAPDGPTISTAEHTVTLMLMAAKNVKQSEAVLRGGGSDFYARHVGIELHDKVLGLVGFGRIARRVADIAAGLGMQILAFDPYLDPDVLPPGGRAASLAELLGTADVVSVHVPLTEQSEGMFDAETFAAMKPGAILVNTARGGLVDLNALQGALDSEHLFGAGLDVTQPEPLPPDHPLLNREDVIVTPHVAAGTAAAKRRIFWTSLEQVIQVLNGDRPAYLVNPDVWDRIASSAS
jgi:phosphoglycerate dehydrogenase-like enzyme